MRRICLLCIAFALPVFGPTESFAVEAVEDVSGDLVLNAQPSPEPAAEQPVVEEAAVAEAAQVEQQLPDESDSAGDLSEKAPPKADAEIVSARQLEVPARVTSDSPIGELAHFLNGDPSKATAPAYGFGVSPAGVHWGASEEDLLQFTNFKAIPTQAGEKVAFFFGVGGIF